MVAPLAGAWIEMYYVRCVGKTVHVAPLAGAWIEIDTRYKSCLGVIRRSPRGSVD